MLGEKIRLPLVMVAGVFAGSAFWWLTLSLGIGSMSSRINQNHMIWINRISGTLIILFGIFALTTIH